MNKDIVLGIDGGLAHLGWSFSEIYQNTISVISLGVIETKKSDKKKKIRQSDDDIRRAKELTYELDCIIKNVIKKGYKVRAICMENMSFMRNASNAAKLKMSHGIIAAFSHFLDLPIIGIDPKDMKKKVTGSESSSKEEVEDALKDKLGISFQKQVEEIKPALREHCVDAVGVIYGCLDSDVLTFLRKG